MAGNTEEGDRGWTGEITHMKGWLKARAEWIDAQFPAEPEFSVASGGVPVGTKSDHELSSKGRHFTQPTAATQGLPEGEYHRLQNDSTGGRLILP